MSLQRWKPHAARFAGPAIILLAAFVAITPLLIRGNACGYDFDFHLVSWFDALQSWRRGILYPHWAPSPGFGAGEPRFVFYPPLSWMTGAALGWVIPWHFVPIVMTFLFLAATGLGTRALAREVLPDGAAAIAGCAAMFFGYALFTGYEKSDFSELAGGFWIPLLLLFILRDRNPSAHLWKRALDGSAALVALTLAGTWLSNAPVGLMASYLLAAVSLAAALLARSWAPVVRAAVGGGLGFGLAGFYLVPAAWEQNWASISEAARRFAIEDGWLFAAHTDPNLATQDWILLRTSVIAVIMIAITLTALLVSWLRDRLPGKLRWWLPLAAIPFAVLFLQFPISLPVWNLLPKLRFLQFPARWLGVLEAPMGIFFASAVWTNHRRWRLAVVAGCAMLFLIDTAGAARYLWAPCHQDESVAGLLDQYRASEVMNDTDEYAPPGANRSLYAKGLPDACLTRDPLTPLGMETKDSIVVWSPAQSSCEATFHAEAKNGKARAEHLRIDAVISHPAYLILHLCTYPAWEVKVNGHVVNSMPERYDGLMAVPVPKGPVNLTVNWTTTPDVLVGRWLSGLSLLLVTALCLLERKLSRPQL